MGPLATADQLEDTVEGSAKLQQVATRVFGEGGRVDGVGSPAGKGFFFAPLLLRADDPDRADAVHDLEVFGPVATLLPYDGSATRAAGLVARAQGSLVTSLYTDDVAFVSEYLEQGGSTSGRLYLGSEKAAGQLPGSGVALPQMLHGGPGRAGGGEELGGVRGLSLYLQRVALTGDRALIEKASGLRS
jgi:oxepin-CoA hydrolase/3-oxo-5,6-dehydrosuberyl-CoA semialdehyde dehydrogenase